MIRKMLSAFVAVLFVVAGCATSPSDGRTSPSEVKTSPAPAPPTTAEKKESKPEVQVEKPTPAPAKPATEQPKPAAEQPKPAAQPKAAAPSGTLSVALSSFLDDQLDPVLTTGLNMPWHIAPLYDRLLDTNAQGQFLPMIAESWNVSSDGLTWTFKLRKDVKFHNGDPLTSAHVKFSLERFISPKSKTASAGQLRRELARIDTPDPFTVLFTTKDVSVDFPVMLSMARSGEGSVMPKKYIEEKGEDYFARYPVGTGPWKFVKHEQGQTLELEAVRDHYRQVPAFERLVIKQVPEESTRVASLKRGEVDVIEIAADRIKEIKEAGLQIMEVPDATQVVMGFSGTWLDVGGVGLDPKVREAAALAINREEIAKEFFLGYATPASRLKLYSGSFGWDPSWKPVPYDPKRSRELLAATGYPSKFKDPTLTLFSARLAGATFLPSVVEIIAGYMEAVGLKVKITPVDAGALQPMWQAKPPNSRIVGHAWFQGTPPIFDMSNIVTWYNREGNVALLHDDEWDAMLAQATKELDVAKRIDIFRRMSNRAHEHYAGIPIVNVSRLYAVSNKVALWEPIAAGELGRMYAKMKHK